MKRKEENTMGCTSIAAPFVCVCMFICYAHCFPSKCLFKNERTYFIFKKLNNIFHNSTYHNHKTYAMHIKCIHTLKIESQCATNSLARLLAYAYTLYSTLHSYTVISYSYSSFWMIFVLYFSNSHSNRCIDVQ